MWVAVVGAAVETDMTGDTIACANNYNLYGVFMLIQVLTELNFRVICLSLRRNLIKLLTVSYCQYWKCWYPSESTYIKHA